MDVLEYIQSLAPASVDRLYKNNHACIAIFRSLPPVAQQIILRMLFVESLSSEIVKSWARPEAQSSYEKAFERLVNTRMLIKTQPTIAGCAFARQ